MLGFRRGPVFCALIAILNSCATIPTNNSDLLIAALGDRLTVVTSTTDRQRALYQVRREYDRVERAFRGESEDFARGNDANSNAAASAAGLTCMLVTAGTCIGWLAGAGVINLISSLLTKSDEEKLEKLLDYLMSLEDEVVAGHLSFGDNQDYAFFHYPSLCPSEAATLIFGSDPDGAKLLKQTQQVLEQEGSPKSYSESQCESIASLLAKPQLGVRVTRAGIVFFPIN